MAERFVFGIGLIAKAQARDWEAVEALLELTLASVAAQTDQDYEVIIAGHDRPRLPPDPRIEFLTVDWPADRPDAFNSDGGMKKTWIGEVLLGRGGGLLMLLDADDWVDRRLVEVARERIAPGTIGGIITDGFATDIQTLRTLRLPHSRAYDIPFHRICGSSVIGRLDPSAEGVWRDPCEALGSHHEWLDKAEAAGLPLARLPVVGNYLINTSENHSERHGPHGEWRRDLSERVRTLGAPLTDVALAAFGLSLREVTPVARYLRREAALAWSS